MPKLSSNSLPSYRLHKQSGQAIVTIAGKDHLLGRHNTDDSRAEYNRLMAEYMIGGRAAPTPQAMADMTVNELVDAFWTHAKSYYVNSDGTPSPEADNFRQALRPLARLYGRTPAAAFGPVALQAVRETMLQPREEIDAKTKTVKKFPGACRTYANRQTDRIKQAFKWATANELTPPAVYQGLASVAGLRQGKSKAREATPVRPVPDAHVEMVLPLLSRQVAAMVQLQRRTGARGGEICIMRTCDIDQRGGKAWIYRPAHHKTEHHGHVREIRIGKRAQEVLAPFLKSDLSAYIFSPTDAEAERRAEQAKQRAESGSPMTPSQLMRAAKAAKAKGRRQRAPRDRYDVASYRRAIARACKLAEIPSWHPHQLRHSAATEINHEFGLDAARAVLGQKSLAMAQRYAEEDGRKADVVMAKIG
ncbi:MAG TPA: tyrosine-type recombinase/integrase [Tepidisphaeraceae bacterium]|jgi:integrase